MLKVILATAVAITSIGWISVANAQRTTTSSGHHVRSFESPAAALCADAPVRHGQDAGLYPLRAAHLHHDPVAAPYANSAYQNFAGQPQRSSESLLAESWRGP